MKNFSLGLSLLLGLGLWMVGCGDSSGCPTGQVSCDGTCIDAIAPTLPAIQVAIFEGRGCAASTCHSDVSPEAELNLSSVADSGANLVSVNSVQVPASLRVAPGDSSASYLMNKIRGVNMAPGTFQMPLNDEGIVLCEPEIDAIRQWIDAGAALD